MKEITVNGVPKNAVLLAIVPGWVNILGVESLILLTATLSVVLDRVGVDATSSKLWHTIGVNLEVTSGDLSRRVRRRIHVLLSGDGLVDPDFFITRGYFTRPLAFRVLVGSHKHDGILGVVVRVLMLPPEIVWLVVVAACLSR